MSGIGRIDESGLERDPDRHRCLGLVRGLWPSSKTESLCLGERSRQTYLCLGACAPCGSTDESGHGQGAESEEDKVECLGQGAAPHEGGGLRQGALPGQEAGGIGHAAAAARGW